MVDAKELKLINKAYDSLYDCVNSRHNRSRVCSPKMLESMEKKMEDKGFKAVINKFDKAVFKKK